jgi:hypothetical protein
MALRFRRSIKLAPGIRMNFSGSGLSWTLGPRGASVGIGSRGTYLNTGIPGTGLYARERLSGGGARAREPAGAITQRATVSVSDDGAVAFTAPNGAPLSEVWVAQARKQHGETIKALVEDKVQELNASLDALGEVHLSTPPPLPPKFAKEPFEHPRPIEPQPQPITFWARLFRKRRERIEAANAAAHAEYERQLVAWEKAGALHRQLQEQKRKRYEDDVRFDVDTMERVLEEAVQEIPWPRETNISFDLIDGGRAVALDVDLPEIEDLPTKVAALTGRGFEIKFTEASATKVRQLYMRHVHGVGFRLMGEVFARLPVCEEVTLSAFSQRPDKQTGRVEDQYLYSVRAKRQDWRLIDFTNLNSVDVVAAFERFELRRKMSKTGVFQPIEPFAGPTEGVR